MYIEVENKNGKPVNSFVCHSGINEMSRFDNSLWFRVFDNFTPQQTFQTVIHDGDWVEMAFDEFLVKRYALSDIKTTKLVKIAKSRGYKPFITKSGVRIGGASKYSVWMNNVNNILWLRNKN